MMARLLIMEISWKLMNNSIYVFMGTIYAMGYVSGITLN